MESNLREHIDFHKNRIIAFLSGSSNQRRDSAPDKGEEKEEGVTVETFTNKICVWRHREGKQSQQVS